MVSPPKTTPQPPFTKPSEGLPIPLAIFEIALPLQDLKDLNVWGRLSALKIANNTASGLDELG